MHTDKVSGKDNRPSADPVANVDLDGLEEATSINAIGGGVVEEAFKGGEIANLAPVTVTHAFVAAKSSTTFFSVTGSFLKGVVGSVWGTIKGVGQIIAHPINTISGVVHAVAHPIQTFNAIKKVVVNTYNEFKNGDANTRPNILGNLSGNIAQVFIGTGEIKVVEEVTDVGKVATDVEELGKLDKAVEKSTDLLEDANDGAEKLVGHHSDPKFMGGDPKQDLIIMPESEHIDLHRELNNHLKKYKDKAGSHMRPQIIIMVQKFNGTLHQHNVLKQ